jgi:hypothetical protein
MMGGSSPQGTTTTTTNTTPWTAQQPYLTRQFSDASALLDRGAPAYYPNDTYVGMNPLQTAAAEAQYVRGVSGSPVMGAADSQITDTINGKYLNPASNPYLSGTYDLAASQLQNQMRSAFGGSDALPGSSGVQQAALSTGLADLGNQIYGQNYQTERQHQLAATELAPTLANQDYTDIGQAQAAGSALQQNQQNEVNADIQRFNYNNNKDWQNLANYAGFVGGNYGGSSTTTQPYYGKGSGSTLGALGGAGLGLALAPFTAGTSLAMTPLMAAGLGGAAGAGAGSLFR